MKTFLTFSSYSMNRYDAFILYDGILKNIQLKCMLIFSRFVINKMIYLSGIFYVIVK